MLSYYTCCTAESCNADSELPGQHHQRCANLSVRRPLEYSNRRPRPARRPALLRYWFGDVQVLALTERRGGPGGRLAASPLAG
jgi:hypothetical protein